MPRQRSPNRDKAFDIYKNHKGNIDLIKIAKILNLSSGTIRGWKNKDQWDNKLNGTFQKKCNENIERSKRKKVNKKSKKEPMQQEVENVLNNSELTDKQRLFCIYYIKYFNATKAYQKAYECDYITANAHGYELLSNVVIKEEIQRLKQNKLNRAILSPDDIFQKYMDIAFSDITDYVKFGQREIKTKTGKRIKYNYVDLHDSDEVDGTVISEVSEGKDGVKVKLNDKMKALNWLSDHMNLATEEQKARIAKLKSDVSSINGSEINKEGINNFIKASTPNENEVKELFKDDEDEKEKED